MLSHIGWRPSVKFIALVKLSKLESSLDCVIQTHALICKIDLILLLYSCLSVSQSFADSNRFELHPSFHHV